MREIENLFENIKDFKQSYLLIHPEKDLRFEIARNLGLKVMGFESFSPNLIDFWELNPETHKYGIDLIKEVIIRVSYKPYQNSKKVIIIHEFQSFKVEAQNAILKTLEEPSDSSVLILTSNHRDNLLKTIVSRCQIFEFEKETRTKEIPSEYIETLQEMKGKRLKEKFDWVASFDFKEDKDKILEILKAWILYYREILMKLLKLKSDSRKVERALEIIDLLEKSVFLIDHTNTNKKLVLENLMIKLS